MIREMLQLNLTLEENYNLKIVKTESIKFYPFPLAKLELKDVVAIL